MGEEQMNEKIMIVDDEAAIADLVEVYLENEGYAVYKCGTGGEALACVAEQPIDLAIHSGDEDIAEIMEVLKPYLAQ